MKPENAQKIIGAINGPNGPIKKREQRDTAISEATTDGQTRLHYNEKSQVPLGSSVPGEIITIHSNGNTIAHTLGAVAQSGFLTTEKPAVIAPTDTEPKLQLISHAYEPSGRLSAVFIDHNPHK